jgi:uncharacterized damage-inducible protein DinB
MDPSRTYDYLVRARERIFAWVRPLRADDYARQFPIGLGTLGRTLTHVMICEWAYVRRIQCLEVPPYEEFPFQDESPPPLATLQAAWSEQATHTKAVLAADRDWNAPFEYRSTFGSRPQIVTATAADLATQLILHEVHHRAQALNMLRHLGVTAEDIDYNYLMLDRRDA